MKCNHTWNSISSLLYSVKIQSMEDRGGTAMQGKEEDFVTLNRLNHAKSAETKHPVHHRAKIYTFSGLRKSFEHPASVFFATDTSNMHISNR